MPSPRPARRDVRTPEQAEHPDGRESKCSMQPEPPRLQRMRTEPELPWLAGPIVVEEPERSGEPEPQADDVEAEALAPRQAEGRGRGRRLSAPHEASPPMVCHSRRAFRTCAVARWRRRRASLRRPRTRTTLVKASATTQRSATTETNVRAPTGCRAVPWTCGPTTRS